MAADNAFGGATALIFDTGPLWEFILYQAVHNLRFHRLEPDLKYIQTTLQYARLSSFIDSFAKRTTTPQVVAEVSYWIEQTEGRGRREIWGLVKDQFRNMKMDEDLVRLLDMPIETLHDFGVVDTSLLQLGLSLSYLRPTILTIDGPLLGKCNSERLVSVHLAAVLST